MSFENFHGKVIWSADDISLTELLSIIEGDFPRYHVAIKLDRLFLTLYGLQSISEVQARGIPVFADTKIIEIPSKCQKLTELHLEHEPWMISIMAGAVSTRKAFGKNANEIDAIKRFADVCLRVGTKPCVVTILTSKDEATVIWEYGAGSIEKVLDYVGQAIELGITDIICSPKEVSAIRKAFDNRVELNTPGVRLPGSSTDDQSRTGTPAAAIADGASRLIIGRDLSRNGDFVKNYKKIMENIKGGAL